MGSQARLESSTTGSRVNCSARGMPCPSGALTLGLFFYFFKTLRPSTFLVARAKEGRQLVPGLVGRAGHLFLTLSKCAV